MDPSTIATNVEVSNKEQILEISWDDGQITKFPLFGLRKNCPCVSCRGGHSSMNIFEPEAFKIKNPPLMNITNIIAVGNHAIQIFWIDGHSSGMYRWQTLRKLSEYLD